MSERGFEFEGEFYPFKVSDLGEDLILIDKFADMRIDEFFRAMGDDEQLRRAPVQLALIATSFRAGTNWSTERIVRTVKETPFSDFVFVGTDEEDEERPPAPADESTGASSSEESKGSPAEASEKSSVTPA